MNNRPDLELIIGREGEQLFPINNNGVSKQHARLSIRRGVWMLEDLDSTNGTYVRNEKGEFVRIATKQITEDTVIRLGDKSINGYVFMAHHVLEQDPNNYAYEFACLLRLREQLCGEEEEMLAKNEKHKKMQRLAPILPFVFTFLPFIPASQMMMWMRGAMLVPMIVGFAFAGDTKKEKAFRRYRENMLVCPKCGRRLSDSDVERECCPACKAHS